MLASTSYWDQAGEGRSTSIHLGLFGAIHGPFGLQLGLSGRLAMMVDSQSLRPMHNAVLVKLTQRATNWRRCLPIASNYG